MVNVKISELPVASTLNSSDQFEINQSSVNKSANTALISSTIGWRYLTGNVYLATAASNVAIGITGAKSNLHVNGNVFATTIEVASSGTFKQGTNTLFDSSANLSNARMNSGTNASFDTFLRGDMSWARAISNSASLTITVGYNFVPYDAGTKSSGTFTPDPAFGNYQTYTNNGAHTLAAPSSSCALTLLVTNGASAGSITFSSFQVGSSTGDSLTTTNGDDFIIDILKVGSIATYKITALQ